jgi:hypothetical protein
MAAVRLKIDPVQLRNYRGLTVTAQLCLASRLRILGAVSPFFMA